MPPALEGLLTRLRPTHADEPSNDERPSGAGRPALAPARRRVTLTGRVGAVTPRSRGRDVVDLQVDLDPLDDDGSPASFVMLGRREIVGVRPGTLLRVHGRAASVEGRVTLFNPAYELMLEEPRP